MTADEAARVGRTDSPTRHGMQVWCGLGESKRAARARLAPAMEAFYQLPFERFERYCPFGTAEDVAEFLLPYREAGCREFNLITQGPDDETAVAAVAAAARVLSYGPTNPRSAGKGACRGIARSGAASTIHLCEHMEADDA